MTGEKNKGFNFYTLGIILSISFVILSIVWMTVTKFIDDDNPEEVTWVG